MEELLVPLAQFYLEFVLEMLVYIGLDAASVRDGRGKTNGCALFVVFALIGARLGGLANWIHPHTVIP